MDMWEGIFFGRGINGNAKRWMVTALLTIFGLNGLFGWFNMTTKVGPVMWGQIFGVVAIIFAIWLRNPSKGL